MTVVFHFSFFFFFNDTATTEIYTLSLHDALPILILGSATPSLETLHLGAVGKVVRFELPDRIGARPLPPVEVIDLRSAERVPDARGVPWTVALDEAVRGALGRGEQVILLLNRRGFATYLQ